MSTYSCTWTDFYALTRIREAPSRVVLTNLKSIWANYYATHHELHDSEGCCFYFVAFVLYRHVLEEWANCWHARPDRCNDKKNLFLLNKGDKLFSPHKAEPDCQINQCLNANMAFGSVVFMAGLHQWINSVGYELTPIIFLYLWERQNKSSLRRSVHFNLIWLFLVNSFKTYSQLSFVDSLKCAILQSCSQVTVVF